MKLPAFQFYVGDWRKDPGVQSLGYHDRGIWFEMLCIMHESPERGKLILNGAKMPEDALARLLGLDNQILSTTLSTLLTYGVASLCEETGAIMSRRMVRDENLRKIRQQAGKMGGNPALLNQNQTTVLKQIETPSSSSSSSISSSPSGFEEIRSNRKRYATHQEVMAYAKSQPMGIPDDCVDAFFDRMEEIGWTDDRGLALADWRARFRRYATNWHNNAQRPNGAR